MLRSRTKLRTAAAALALGSLLMTTPAAAGTEPLPTVTTGPVFNDPSGDATAEGRILSHLGRLVDGAEPQSSIRISLYLYGSQWLTDRLIAARNRGVTVQVVLDRDTAGYPAVTNLKTELERLGGDSWVRICKAEEACLAKDPGTTSTDPNGWYDNVNHNKYFLFSRTKGNGTVPVDNVVVQSSGNLVEWDRTMGWNDAMTVAGNKELFDAYTAYFADQAGAAAGEIPQVSDYPHETQAGKAKVYFFPRSTTDVVVNILKTVAQPLEGQVPCHGNDPGFGTSDGRTKIRIAQGHITRPEVAEELWNLANAGCHVDIVYRKLDNPPNTAVAGWLTKPTAKGRIALHQLYNDERGGTGTHTKYLLVEGTYLGGKNKKIVFTGSHTYTVTALKYNDEALLKYEDNVDTAVFDAYVKNFEAQRAAAEREGL
ncbi:MULTISPECIES: phospholipase D-like domain-containing protein [Streptomyces]|uniref:phospholipase D-like domain-containing protein n=1 Tax=Streptomyces TaxID=1883 RepID=UPI0013198856|nr:MULTISPECIES: phospholipase D-like domain-containing protein [Streptomyces]QGZ49305.1 hypothetical protein GPZ77_13795 [Streptomyces sp. QHH-9511]GGU10387.1 hypothetical protein GCM10010272_64420 [Streptomyces lateritius]